MPGPYKVWPEGDEDNAIVEEFHSHEDAVRNACHEYMSEHDGHHWLNGSTLYCKEENGDTKKFTVEVDYEPVFYAYEQETITEFVPEKEIPYVDEEE